MAVSLRPFPLLPYSRKKTLSVPRLGCAITSGMSTPATIPSFVDPGSPTARFYEQANTRPKRGRPPIPVDATIMRHLGFACLSLEQAANYLGMTSRGLRAKCKAQPELRQAFEEGYAEVLRVAIEGLERRIAAAPDDIEGVAVLTTLLSQRRTLASSAR